jgi:AAA+ ATPase superfamily predicted ATPase
MKFYNRASELTELERIRNLSFSSHSRMTVVTGRRRSGKTMLIMKSIEDTPAVYIFVSRKKKQHFVPNMLKLLAKR